MDEIKNNIKTGEFHHIYLLYGDEHYLRLQFRNRLTDALMPDNAGMNFGSYEGNSISEEAFIDQAETMPFFAERRVMVWNRSGFFKNAAALLPDYIKNIPDYLYLIFVEDAVDQRGRMFKAVKKYGHAADFARQDEKALSAWILRMLQDENLKIRSSAMSYLLSRTGTDMEHIRLETDKLIHYCAGKGEVTREAIDAVTADPVENQIFEMVRAITEGRRKDAMAMYTDLITLRESPLGILYLIGREYHRLMIVREMTERGASKSEIASKAGMPPFAVSRSQSLARRFSPNELEAIIGRCVQTEEDVKNGNLQDRLAVELLMMEV